MQYAPDFRRISMLTYVLCYSMAGALSGAC